MRVQVGALPHALALALATLAALPASAQCTSYRVSQESSPGAGDFDANVLGCVEPYTTGLTAAQYYAYDGFSFNGPAPLLTDDRAHLFLVDASDGLSLFSVLDGEDATGGKAEMRFELFGDANGAARTIEDGPPATGDQYTGNPGDSLFTSRHHWSSWTDGEVLSGLDPGWSMQVQFAPFVPTDVVIGGLTSWVAYSSSGGDLALNLVQGRRVRLDCCDPGEPLTCEVIPQPGRDELFLISGGCESPPDRYMDAGEKITLTVSLVSPTGLPTQVRLRPVLVDLNSPADCPCDSTPSPDCPDPARGGNSALPPGILTVNPAGFVPVSPIANVSLPVMFNIDVDASLIGKQKIELLLETNEPRCVHATRHVLNADEVSAFYSTDFPSGGTQVRDYDNSETEENPDAQGRFETIVWSDLTAGGARNPALRSPWNFDGGSGGFRVGLGDASDPEAWVNNIANWGSDRDFNGIEEGECDNPPGQVCYEFGLNADPRCAVGGTCTSVENTIGIPLENYNTKGGCGWQSRATGTCTADADRGCFFDEDCEGTCQVPNNPILSTFEPCGALSGPCLTTVMQCPDFAPNPREPCTVPADCGGFPCDVVPQACFDDAGFCSGAAPTTGGVWHSGQINGPFNNCDGALSSQCANYRVITSLGGTLNWFELLVSPVIEKVDQSQDADLDPVAVAEILDLAWNQSLNLADEHATFTWELDNDLDDPTQVDLVADLVVTGSLVGPLGAVAGGAPPVGVGYPLFAPMAQCVPSGHPCVVATDCPVSETCVWVDVSVNGTAGNDRHGANACFFEGVSVVPPANRTQLTLAGPLDDDVDNDGGGDFDEYVAVNGPIRNMSISKAGGPDMREVLYEDLVGETGNNMQFAFGFLVSEGTPSSPPVESFGVSVDDVVIEWREYTLIEDAGKCCPGEVTGVSSKLNSNGTIDISYTPACESVDNSIVWGDIASPGVYTGADCSVGNSGLISNFNPGIPSYFFIVVANDAVLKEGSYGTDSSGNERPPWPGCYDQCLDLRCD